MATPGGLRPFVPADGHAWLPLDTRLLGVDAASRLFDDPLLGWPDYQTVKGQTFVAPHVYRALLAVAATQAGDAYRQHLAAPPAPGPPGDGPEIRAAPGALVQALGALGHSTTQAPPRRPAGRPAPRPPTPPPDSDGKDDSDY